MKFYGRIGFVFGEKEVKPGVWEHEVVEKPYCGDVLKSSRTFTPADQQNDTFRVNNTVSIISDLYAQQNFASIRYIFWNEKKLKVTSVTVDYPRLTLEIGGWYDGENAT